jgi:hypothetical protein
MFKLTAPRFQMNFNRMGHSDDWLFVLALLVPAVFAGVRYFESDRQITEIARAGSNGALVAVDNHAQAHLRVASAQGQGEGSPTNADERSEP